MPNISNRFKLTALSAAIIAAHGLSAYAQDEQAAGISEEEVIVVGIKAAIQRSIDDKRNAQNIQDTINAEDIGKTTDQNIAEALGRVTGVTLQTRDGEGTTVTVRGAGANQNNISLNGQQLTSTDFNQSVDLSSFSADILSKLEVVKTPSADHEEGSLGANINLVTVRPLDVRENVRSGTAQWRYNEFADENDHKLQLSVSQKFFDDMFGIALTAYDEKNTYRKDQFLVEDYVESSTVRIARDQNGDVISDTRGILATAMGYELHQNTSDRQGLTLGLQLRPTDTTEIIFDGTYAEQSLEQNFDGVRTRRPNQGNFAPPAQTISTRGTDPFFDPQEDWYTINTQNRTFTRYLNRNGPGDLLRSEGGSDNTNTAATLKLKQDIGSSIQLELGAGYSKSESENKPSAYINMQNWNSVNGHILFDAAPYGEENGIQPVGYDCSGSRCEIVFGDTFADLGENLLDFQDENGVTRPGWWDNSANTGFNPQDINAQHLSFISETDREVSDEITSANFDVDWDIDEFGITKIEFGGKISSREKDVDNQTYQFGNITRSELIYDENDNPVGIPGGGVTDIRGPLVVSGDSFAYDDFMESLGYGRDGATRGWAPLSARGALDLILDDANTIRNSDATETRITELDTSALYLKTNFSLFDDRLTGDIGVRYVETEVEAQGYAGVNFFSHTAFSFEREFDLVHQAQLRDTSLPECPDPVYADPDNPQEYEIKFQRIDGLGWDTSSGPDPSGWTRMPDFGPCHEPQLVALSEYYDNLAADPNFDGTRPQVNWVSMWRHADVSTTHLNGWTDNLNETLEWDGQGTDLANYTNPNERDLTLASIRAENSHKYSNVLPSLNLNFAVTDTVAARLALSKTMSRPEIDQLRPGFRVAETAWRPRPSNSVSMFNTQLEPLESKNIDISLEWYPTDTTMLAAAFFQKDISNFTEVESLRAYIRDLRSVDTSQGIDPDTLVMLASDDASNNYGLNGCMPNRTVADFAFDNNPENWSDDYRDLCGQYSINKVRNGAGAKIQGVELQYSQSYDFLPGYFLSGLGASVNYTYQDSEYESDFSSIDANVELPSLPVADTPEHTYNATVFWEQEGHQVRVSYRGSSDSLVGTDGNTGLNGRTWNQGSLWNEGRDTLDISATYQFSENISLTLQAINLTDAEARTYFTSRTLLVDRMQDADGNVTYGEWQEGNPLDGEASKSRTVSRYKVGTTYRLGLRVNF